MPYKIKQVAPMKFKVCKASNLKECYSKKGLPLKRAKKQRTAIILSELRRKGKIAPRRKRKKHT